MGDGYALTVAEAFANQVAYCRNNGAPITARIVKGVADLLGQPDPGAFVERIRDWPGAPLADAVPLRSAGGLHALHLSRRAPELAPLYAGEPADVAGVLAGVVKAHEAFLLPSLDGPPQTNEAGRSWGFAAAMLWLSDQGLPSRFECLEIGSSAGINLMMDRYRYDLGGVVVGPDDAAMDFAPEWRGLPPPSRPIEIASLKGCDVAPLDLRDPAQALRLTSYVWPEHAIRFERIRAAVGAAKLRPPRLLAMNAADFVERELALPQAPGTTRMLMHSIVWQYMPEDQQRRVSRAMEAAAMRASPDKGLAWVQLEANRTLLNHGLTVRRWPGGGEPEMLAGAHAHGAWVEWKAP